jgi:hypothetical protein
MKYFISLLLIVFTNEFCTAQKFSTSINAQLSIPQGDYKEANQDAGYGLRFNFLYKPSYITPVKLGIELGLQEKARATEYFSGYVYGYYDEFKVSATSNIFSLMFITRIQSSAPHKLKPFIDVTAGWNVFFSTVNVEDLSYYSGYGGYGGYSPSYSNSSKAHWAFAYGATGGIDIPLNRRDGIGLELKVAYLIGSYTDYLTDPYIDGNGNVSFIQNSSRTNMLIPQAGVRITID